ncbi:unnamed protein product [Arctogadus glacialis]
MILFRQNPPFHGPQQLSSPPLTDEDYSLPSPARQVFTENDDDSIPSSIETPSLLVTVTKRNYANLGKEYQRDIGAVGRTIKQAIMKWKPGLEEKEVALLMAEVLKHAPSAHSKSLKLVYKTWSFCNKLQLFAAKT